MVDTVIDDVPALPMRPAPDSVSNGAVSEPTANPAAAATMATRTYSASSTARRAAGCLEEPDASGLFGHPAADQHRKTRHGEQTEQPGSDQQQDLGVSGQLGGLFEDFLPGREA
jgi:hypothetical protein